MWSLKGVAFIWCVVLLSPTLALPVSKTDNETDTQKPELVILETDAMLVEEKPTDNSKPSEMAVDPKPIEVKPTEQTKPSEPAGPTTTIFETVPLSLTPPQRPQLLYDQRQDGKYNIRADLENFIILVVPSSGNSLLDLLKRSGQRQPQHNKRTHHTKHHKKYNSVSATGKPGETKKMSNRLDYLNRPDGEAEAPIGGEFIEGRTPYHVDISSDEILKPSAYGVRSLATNAATNADIPVVNLDDNMASTSGASDSTIILSTIAGKQDQQPNLPSMPSSNTETSPRLPKSIIIGGYGNPFSNLNSVLLTRKTYDNAPHDSYLSKNYNNYFSRQPSVQIVDKSTIANEYHGNDVVDPTNLINSQSKPSDSIDLTDSNTPFNSLNVGNIDRLALAGDSATKTDANLANAQWELTLLGAEEQCGPDRRRDSYGVCQFVPADYATT